MNFARDVLDRRPPDELALVELTREGARREWSFGEVAERSARLAGALRARAYARVIKRQGRRRLQGGVPERQGRGRGPALNGDDLRGEVVMTLIGNRPEWVMTMCACMRIGAVALPCTEQLRAKDLRMRIEVARPSLIVADERNRAELEAALSCSGTRTGMDADDAPGRAEAETTDTPAGAEAPQVLLIPDETLFTADHAAAVELDEDDPCLITFTSGTAGEPKAVLHAQRYLAGQRLQATHWLGPRSGELVWCTAASGWSKSARNVFIAPWIAGAAALLHDARFDPHERLEIIARERVNVLCMAPTEYRVIAARTSIPRLDDLRLMVAAGEALNPEVLHEWRAATGIEIRDGYGQTETGQMTGIAHDEPARPGSMGRALPGVELSIDAGELVADPRTVPTFFLGYLGEGVTRVGGRGGESDSSKPTDPGDPGKPTDPSDSDKPSTTNSGDSGKPTDPGDSDKPGATNSGDSGKPTDPGDSDKPSTTNSGDSGKPTDPGDSDKPGATNSDNPANHNHGWLIEDRRDGGPWHTGDRVRMDEDGYLWFEGRSDDVIVSAGYRIGPFEVESALVSHPAVAEAAAVAAPDAERGAVVRAIVVLRPDAPVPGPEFVRELQEHVKRETAPYKYPRIVEFAPELPKTASGKVKRAELRQAYNGI